MTIRESLSAHMQKVMPPSISFRICYASKKSATMKLFHSTELLIGRYKCWE